MRKLARWARERKKWALKAGLGAAGVPFRDTHHLSGAAVKMAEERGCSLFDLSPADLRSIHPLFADDVAEVRQSSNAEQKQPVDVKCVGSLLLESQSRVIRYELACFTSCWPTCVKTTYRSRTHDSRCRRTSANVHGRA